MSDEVEPAVDVEITMDHANAKEEMMENVMGVENCVSDEFESNVDDEDEEMIVAPRPDVKEIESKGTSDSEEGRRWDG